MTTINQDVLASLPSTASKIRYLSELNLSTAQIVKALAEYGVTSKNGDPIRYQHVNNESIRLGLKKVVRKEDSTALKIRVVQLEAELNKKKQSDAEAFEKSEQNQRDAEAFLKNEEFVG